MTEVRRQRMKMINNNVILQRTLKIHIYWSFIFNFIRHIILNFYIIAQITPMSIFRLKLILNCTYSNHVSFN